MSELAIPSGLISPMTLPTIPTRSPSGTASGSTTETDAGGNVSSRSAIAQQDVSDNVTTNADTILARRAAQGDMDAFRILVERYQRPMAALVSRMTPNADDVDDVVQELFLRAWKGLPNFRGDAQFSTWLYRIAVNTAIKHRSRRRNEVHLSLSADDISGGVDALPAPEDGTPSSGGDPFRVAERREREEAVREAVASLPDKQRVVVALHYFEGHSCEEISKMVGCSLGTVWSRLHYACKRLKGALETSEGL
jgi:RNA polymerase sigma-70 factor (ECF subfamily)